MNIATPIARAAYSQREAPVRTARAQEYDLLARCTQKMAMAWARRKDDFPLLATAVHENLQLWCALAIDVADEGNHLPSALRAQSYLSLGLYSKRVRITTTLRNLDSFKDKKLTVLLERFMGDDWATRSDDYAEDEPNRDYECIKELGDNFEIRILIGAYVKSDSPLCRVVVTGVTERIVREETREIVCA